MRILSSSPSRGGKDDGGRENDLDVMEELLDRTDLRMANHVGKYVFSDWGSRLLCHPS